MLRFLVLFVVLVSPGASVFAAEHATAAPPQADSVRSCDANEDSHFHWRGALVQSGIFLAIQHTLNVDHYLDAPHDHFWSRYADSVSRYNFTGWHDGGTAVTNYLGHPFMGAVTGFIEIQNDPASRGDPHGRTYWKSRMKAFAWATAYSVQWEIGPLSESSLGNFGLVDFRDRQGRLVNGTGLSDLIVTPFAGLGWVLLEDTLDRKLLRGRAGRSATVLCMALNPARTTANILRLKPPCFRNPQQLAP